jgi:hypothetical protein
MRQGAYWGQMEDRLVDWVDRALRRKPSREAPTAGAIRVAAVHSSRLRGTLATTAGTLIKRRSYDRPLYTASVRALADANDRRLGPMLAKAMEGEDCGGLATIAASARCRSGRIDDAIARAASNRRPEIAFAAMLVHRLRSLDKGNAGPRSDRQGTQLMGAAARLKESARIDVCTQLLAPLAMDSELGQLPNSLVPALKALRDAERHLGRWLVLARVGVASGDSTPIREAQGRASQGSTSAKAAWSLLGWALVPSDAIPDVRPTAEIVSRLSDRPTAERDMSFLFRLADQRAPSARSLLETLCRPPMREPTALRAASALAHRYESEAAVNAVRKVVAKSGNLHGIAVAALHDGGAHKEAREHAAGLGDARSLAACVWGGLVFKAKGGRVIDEASFRLIEQGLVH